MKFYLCIDDTDTIDSIGTGQICEYIKAELEEKNIASCSFITRHQLLIHSDIPYTSHNSSMCFEGVLEKGDMDEVVTCGIDVLKKYHAQGSDPGLCVVPAPSPEMVEKLCVFGRRATEEVLTKEEAYSLADEMGLHLTEHGGTGQGVIGAIAGVGLRLSGNHGEAKGVLKKITNTSFSVGDLKAHYGIHQVMNKEGRGLVAESVVQIKRPTKVMIHNHKMTLLVEETDEGYVAFDKKIIRAMQMGNHILKTSDACSKFKEDVYEERLAESVSSCLSCTYRRWTEEGFECVLDSASS